MKVNIQSSPVDEGFSRRVCRDEETPCHGGTAIGYFGSIQFLTFD